MPGDTQIPASTAHTRPITHRVVLGHPDPHSFCRSLADTYCKVVETNGQTAMLHDLYDEGFDPLLRSEERPGRGCRPRPDVAAELAVIRDADVLTLIYPIWFGLPPAIIKGYVDRVLGADFSAANLSENRTNPNLSGKRLVILSSSATTRPWLEEKGQYSALRRAFDLYLTEIFGMRGADRVHFDAIGPHAKVAYVEQCLERLRQRARVLCADLARERHSAVAREALAKRCEYNPPGSHPLADPLRL